VLVTEQAVAISVRMTHQPRISPAGIGFSWVRPLNRKRRRFELKWARVLTWRLPQRALETRCSRPARKILMLLKKMERAKGFEPSTPTLARSESAYFLKLLKFDSWPEHAEKRRLYGHFCVTLAFQKLTDISPICLPVAYPATLRRSGKQERLVNAQNYEASCRWP
jgi:hypothetical protein